MIQTVEGITDKNGNIKLPPNIHLPGGRRALVTVLEEPAESEVPETALLSEPVLSEDWLREEEGKAWQFLQSEQ